MVPAVFGGGFLFNISEFGLVFYIPVVVEFLGSCFHFCDMFQFLALILFPQRFHVCVCVL